MYILSIDIMLVRSPENFRRLVASSNRVPMRLYKNMVFLTSVENLFLEDDKKAIATFLNTHNL